MGVVTFPIDRACGTIQMASCRFLYGGKRVLQLGASIAKGRWLTTTSNETKYEATSRSTYGGRHTVTLIPGDGIGPELAACVKNVFRLGFPPIHKFKLSPQIC